MASKKTKKAEPEKLKEHEERIEKQEQTPEGASEGIVESLLRGLGDAIPGLGGLMKGLGKSEAFRERLAEVEEEIEARLGEIPLKENRRMGERENEGKFSHSPTLPLPHSLPHGRSIPRRTVKEGEYVASVKWEKEVSTDVFDEGDHWRVIVELPGVEEKDIRIDVKGEELIISADTVSRTYHRAVRLPGTPTEMLKTAYRNGVLEMVVKKENT